MGLGMLKPFLEALEEERDLDTDHPATDARQQFIVYAKDGKRARQVVAVAVQRRHKAQQFFGTSIIWKEPAVILVYPDKAAYHRSWGMYGTAGVQLQGRYRGKGVKVKLVVTFEGEGLLEHTLPHELMHLLITDMSNRHYFDGRRRDVVATPVWIQEGLAEYMTAGAQRRKNFEKLVYWSLHEKKQIPLQRMLEQMPYDRNIMLHYAQSYSFIAFIAATVPNGRVRLRNYITSYNEPRLAKSPRRAFELAFQGVAPSIEVLEKRWHAWVAKHYRRHFAPVLLRTRPTDKARDASPDGKIWVQFDKPIDPATMTAKTMALRTGDSKRLGDDEENLLRQASFEYDSLRSVLLIEVAGGLDAGCDYTLAFSDHVRDTRQHGLVAERFDELKRGDWWKSKNVEPLPGQKRAQEKKEKPPKLVTSITFTTKAKETDDARAPD